MSRRPLSLQGRSRRSLRRPAAVTASAHADTCNGLSLAALTPGAPPARRRWPSPSATSTVTAGWTWRRRTAAATTSASCSATAPEDSRPARASALATASNPVDIAAGDLDRDGFLDLVVAFGSQRRSGSCGASGAVRPHEPVHCGVFPPSRLYLADFTRDGKLDLVVVSSSGTGFSLFEGDGALGFPTRLATIDVCAPGPPERPAAVALGDFNRDGQLDLAVAFETYNERRRVLLGNGPGQPPSRGIRCFRSACRGASVRATSPPATSTATAGPTW